MNGKEPGNEVRQCEDDLFEAILAKAVEKDLENEIAAIPPLSELQKAYSFSKRHNRMMKELFSVCHREKRANQTLLWFRRTVALITVIITILAIGLMFIPGVYAAVSEAVIQQYEKFTKFVSQLGDSPVTTDVIWRPEYIPRSFLRVEVISEGDINQFVYSNKEHNDISFSYIKGVGSISINNENVSHRTETYDGVVYQIFESLKNGINSSIVWEMQGYSFLLSAEYPIAELIEIALSVSKE